MNKENFLKLVRETHGDTPVFAGKRCYVCAVENGTIEIKWLEGEKLCERCYQKASQIRRQVIERGCDDAWERNGERR